MPTFNTSWVVSLCVLACSTGCSELELGASAEGGDGTVARTRLAVSDTSYAPDPNPNLATPERGVANRIGEGNAGDVETIKFHFLYLGDVCKQPLTWEGRSDVDTSPVLKAWADTAVAQRDLGRKVIFRPRYDTPGAEGALNVCGRLEADTYDLMQNHVQAIAAMLRDPEIKPLVAFVEMGYLGSWGEWNTASINASCRPSPDAAPTVALCRSKSPVLLAASTGSDRITFAKYVIDTYRNGGVTGMLRPIELRRPEFHNDLMSTAFNVPATQIGFYNDCFMSSSSDSGTFTRIKSDYSDYTDLYPASVLPSVQAAQDHMQATAAAASQGGETCPVNGAEPWRDGTAVDTRMSQDSFGYIHGVYATGFRPEMVSDQKWDLIKSRLGYSYHVTQVSYPATATAGASITVSADLQNRGYARIPLDRTAYVVVRGPVNYVVGSVNPNTAAYTLLVPTAQANQSVYTWVKSLTATTPFSQTFPAPPVPGTYSIRLYIPDVDCVNNAFCDATTKRNYEVKLATLRGGQNVFDTTNGTNDLGVTLTVTSGSCASGGNLVQNCDFAGGTSPWHCGVGGTAAATCSVVNGEYSTAITNPGTAAYQVQPNQTGLSLVNGTTYTVSFDARASVSRNISVSVTMNHDSFSSYSGVRTFTLGTTMANYSFTFTQTQPSDTNVKLEFDLGANGSNTVVLDNVVLHP